MSKAAVPPQRPEGSTPGANAPTLASKYCTGNLYICRESRILISFF